jgi:hypothetical protein
VKKVAEGEGLENSFNAPMRKDTWVLPNDMEYPTDPMACPRHHAEVEFEYPPWSALSLARVKDQGLYIRCHRFQL